MNQKKYVDINNTRGEEMRKKWERIIKDSVDPFDPVHVEKYIGGEILQQGDHWYVFKNDHPYADVKHQLVIVTNEFYVTDEDLPSEVWLELQTVKRILCAKYNITGGGLIMRFGDTSFSGGSVTHLHAQLIVPEENTKVAAWFGSKKEE